jgi:hypothetical protein
MNTEKNLEVQLMPADTQLSGKNHKIEKHDQNKDTYPYGLGLKYTTVVKKKKTSLNYTVVAFSTYPRSSIKDFNFIWDMGISGVGKRWPPFENAVEQVPRRTCVETGRGTDPVPPFRSPPDGVFDNPRATRMIISDGAMPCEL